ncbi:hypothetical protein [Clostridium sp. JN-9]|uniref:hypothetical protein n=1 Tax=Clostridium sp. JN-9 TaxID=2507159 RepID=UPI0013E8E998|nr:hypothetical protein [Clostridium sp. JN-9]
MDADVILFIPGVLVFPRAFALYLLGMKLGGCHVLMPFAEGLLTLGLQPHLKPFVE